MTDTKKLLELRKRLKRRKPVFIRQDAHKHKRLKKKWRNPRGLHSKMRLKLRGHRKSVSPGYKSPKDVKDYDISGIKTRLVSSAKELLNIGKEDTIIIRGGVGLKKKIEIVRQAQKLSIKIHNIKDPDKFLKENEERLQKQKDEKEKLKQEKQKKLKKREEKAKEKIKEKEEKEKKEEKTPEDLVEKVKKEEEEKKRELDKVLTKKN